MTDKPVCPLIAALHIETAAKGPSRLQHPAGLPLSGFLIRESVKAVEGQHDIEALVFKRKCADVPGRKAIFFNPKAFAFS